MHREQDAIADTTIFFGRNHLDLRARGPANLDFLAKTLTTQPEFAACMVRKVLRFVYEGTPVPPAVERDLLERFRTNEHMDELVEGAVLARAFGEPMPSVPAD